MRIIAGEFRGRKLLPPEGDATRPITDRVKQSLFDILAPRIEGGRIYDLFAGTGSMGLECLSRGASQARFFEADRSALDRLKKNIAALKLESRSQVIPGDLFKWFSANTPTECANLIFLDPPYRFLKEQPEKLLNLAEVIAANHLTTDGLLIFRHDAIDELALPPLHTLDRREYGGMVLEFLARK
ncbi:MAG TPA: 16S rRNA (guanine(966)-N(2))-methyltransferase RsmD [Tepidisphaeraceae bacterium]|jgi:16S rRNA (guanine966-N2)-methyltransferase|nr:16S rRNA (guanine(966)-N(2))-methyltransferase RsmD [Tepidisphaeraceae bacterium]